MRLSVNNYRRAFTLLEGLVAFATLVVLVAVFFPMVARSKYKSNKLGCVYFLTENGIALHIWAGDNNDKYPMDVSITNGGAQEMIETGNVAACFQVLSNELATPKFLVCPDDSEHNYATNFDTSFTRSNISYFIGLHATESDPNAILSGDDNVLVNGQPIRPSVLNLQTNIGTWTSARHPGYGNILIADGSVQSVKEMGRTTLPGIGSATNSVVIP